MAKAIVTPTDLREFANILQKNIEEFTHIEKSMNQKLSSYDWQDPVAVKFKADFEATKEPLNKLKQKMEEFRPYLTQKADILDEGYTGDTPSIAAFKVSAAAFAGGVGVGGALMGDSPSIEALKKGIRGEGAGDSPSIAALKKGIKGEGAGDSPSIEALKKGIRGEGAGDSPSIEALKKGIKEGKSVDANYDISKAITHLKDNAREKSVKGDGRCAEYVRKALEAGGIKIAENERSHAYGYKDLLPKKGFKEQDITFNLKKIKKEDGTSMWTYVPSKELQKGDIVVFDRIPGKKEYGHIQMYDGQNWTSDFKQKYFRPWADVDLKKTKYTVFRK